MTDCDFVNEEIHCHPGYYCTECGDYVFDGAEGVHVYVGVCSDCFEDIHHLGNYCTKCGDVFDGVQIYDGVCSDCHDDIHNHPGYQCTECGDYVLGGAEGVHVYVGVCSDCYDDIVDEMISYEEYIRD
jgi:predicted amidophosphoribosyltransferase